MNLDRVGYLTPLTLIAGILVRSRPLGMLKETLNKRHFEHE